MLSVLVKIILSLLVPAEINFMEIAYKGVIT